MRQCKHIRKLEDRGPAMIPKLHSFTHSFIHSSSRHSLNACSVLHTGVKVGDTEMIKSLCPPENEDLQLPAMWHTLPRASPVVFHLIFTIALWANIIESPFFRWGDWGSKTKQHRKRPKAAQYLLCALVSVSSSSHGHTHQVSAVRAEERGGQLRLLASHMWVAQEILRLGDPGSASAIRCL